MSLPTSNIWSLICTISHSFIDIYSKISGSGEFQVKVLSFNNANGRTAAGSCCGQQDGGGEVQQPPNNSSCPSKRTCRTYFRVCLSHYQTDIALNGPCTYVEMETDVIIVNNSFVWWPLTTRGGEDGLLRSTSETSSTAANLIRLPFKFSWPVSVQSNQICLK